MEKCPYCGEEMKSGYLKSKNAVWSEDANAPAGLLNFFDKSAVILGMTRRIEGDNILSYHCPKCHVIIVEYDKRF